MIEVPSDPRHAVVVGDFLGFAPDELFLHWISPDLLTQWWPQTAEVDAQYAGSFRLTWPDMEWELTGEYTKFQVGRHLGFTWQWRHEEGQGGEQEVNVFFAPIDGGTRLAIFHGPFQGDDASRRGIIEGWIHFGMRLAGLKKLTIDGPATIQGVP
jgi:uncharacterized protein YndB with AHSA1/START domain